MKNLFITSLLLAACLVSCDKAETETVKDNSNMGTVTLNIQTSDNIGSRAGTPAPVVAGFDTRYIVEVWNADNTARISRTVQLNNTEFSLILNKSLSHNVAVWVDYVNDVDDTNPSLAQDKFYATADFNNIMVKSTNGDAPGPFNGRVFTQTDDIAMDAFSNWVNIPANSTSVTSITVSRPFARISVYAADAGVWKNQSYGGVDLQFSFVQKGYYVYDALTKTSKSTTNGTTYINTIPAATYNAYPDNTPQLVVSGLVLANDAGNNLPLEIYYRVGSNAKILAATVDPVNFKRNYKTNLTGNVIFNTVPFSIIVNPIYENPDQTVSF